MAYNEAERLILAIELAQAVGTTLLGLKLLVQGYLEEVWEEGYDARDDDHYRGYTNNPYEVIS
jgi:hypothetical protein